eukprot:2965139-Prorocentrum_lima.AAC.1
MWRSKTRVSRPSMGSPSSSQPLPMRSALVSRTVDGMMLPPVHWGFSRRSPRATRTVKPSFSTT